MNQESFQTTLAQAAIVSVGFTVFFAIIGLIPATNAYSGFPLNAYWGGLLTLVTFIFVGFLGGRWLSGFKSR